MAGRTDIKAGRAFVELFLKNNIKRGLNEASKQLKSFGMGAMRLGSQIAGVGAAMTAAFIAPIKAAGDLMETTSKFGAVFGSEAQDATKWMEAFGESVGRGRKELMDGMSSFQAFFSGMGLGAKEAAGFSKELTALSVDFASFHNMSDPEAMQRFISALSGSGEVLSMYGVNIMEAALNQKLLAMGFPTISKGATETQKVLARMSIIKESMGRQGAVGDAIKTAGSFSNQLKKMRGELANTAAEIGNALLPVVTPLVSWVAEAVKQFAEWAKVNQGVIRAAFLVSAGIAAAGAAIFAFGAAAVAASSLIGGMVTVATMLFSPAGLLVAGVTAAVVAIGQWTGAFNEVGKVFSQVWGGIQDALAGGDFLKAAEIAAAGFKLIIAQMLDWVSNNVSSVLGKALGGDFRGAMEDVIQDLGTLWDVFVMNIVKAFQSAVDAIGKMWLDMITKTQTALGTIGAALRVAGFDSAADATYAARSAVGVGGMGVKNEIGAVSSAGKAIGDALGRRAAGNVRGAEVSNRAAGAQAELDRLTSEAASMRARREAEKAAAGAAVGAGGNIAAMKTTAGTGVFSAVAALRMGGGMKPEDKIVAEAKRGNKEVVKKLDRNIQAVEKIQLQVVG